MDSMSNFTRRWKRLLYRVGLAKPATGGTVNLHINVPNTEAFDRNWMLSREHEPIRPSPADDRQRDLLEVPARPYVRHELLALRPLAPRQVRPGGAGRPRDQRGLLG